MVRLDLLITLESGSKPLLMKKGWGLMEDLQGIALLN